MLGEQAAREQPATVFLNGRIHVMDGRNPAQEAIAIEGGRILGVGTADDMSRLVGRGARRIDLGGAALMPGLIDTHPHLLHFAARERSVVTLFDAKNHDDIVARIRAKAAETPKGQWIVCSPIGEPHYFIRRSYLDLPERRIPDRWVLDRATTDHPVFIQAWAPKTPNICAFNSAGLAAIGITDFVPDRVCDIWIEKEEGRVTGVLRGAVNNYYSFDPFWTQVLTKLPGPATWELIDSTIGAMGDYNRQGCTAIYEGHNMAPPHVQAYKKLRADGRLTLRVMAALESESYAYPPFQPKSMDAYMATLELGRSLIEMQDDFLRVTGLTFAQGSPCGPGALRNFDPYEGPFGEPTRGITFLTMEKQRAFTRFCAEHGIRGNFVTAGLRDNEDALVCMEELAGEVDFPGRKWLIQHALLISEEQARRFHRLGCQVTCSVGFAWGKGDVYGERMGRHIWQELVPLKRLLNVGLTVGGSTDWGPKNLWEQIALAETHEFCGSGHHNDTPDHKLTRMESLLMWTRDAARVLNWDGIGTLEPGNRADLIVVDRDPLSCPLEALPATKVLGTWVDGIPVWDAEAL